MRQVSMLAVVALLACSSKETETVTVPGSCDDASASDAPAVDTTVTTDSEVPPIDTAVGDATSETTPGVDAAPDAPACAIKTGGNLCNTVPKFTFAGKQLVDGNGDEFCDVPATTFGMKDGVAYPSGVTIPAGLSAKVQARVAWSSLGIHAHFNVIDPAVAGLGPYLASDKVSFQIGGKSPLLGEYIGYGKDKGMLNIQMRPPSPRDLGIPGLTGRPEGEAHLFFIGHLRSTDTICRGLELPVVAPIEFASRVTADGYAHELFIPWASLNRTAPPSSGTAIALDMTLFDTEMPGIEMPPYFDDTGLQGVVAYRINTTGVDLASSCCSGSLYPDCDDRTWCSPSLE